MENRPTVVIWGITGLMGASLGLALKKHTSYEVIGIGRNTNRLQAALGIGAADAICTTPEEALSKADFFLMATPTSTLLSEGPDLIAKTGPDCLSMDLGSVKGVINDSLAEAAHTGGKSFLPCHPMCGSEKTGLEYASADLYQGARVILCHTPYSLMDYFLRANRFWESIGANTREMDPVLHDKAVAGISHLPHLISSLLALAALEENPSGRELAASGFRDSTRLADADPALWRDIFQHNQPALLERLDHFQHYLNQARHLVESSDFQALEYLLDQARQCRKTVYSDSTNKEDGNG